MNDLILTLRVLKHSSVELTNGEMFKLLRSYFYADEALEMVNSSQIEWLIQTDQTIDVMYNSLINQIQKKMKEELAPRSNNPWLTIGTNLQTREFIDDNKHNELTTTPNRQDCSIVQTPSLSLSPHPVEVDFLNKIDECSLSVAPQMDIPTPKQKLDKQPKTESNKCDSSGSQNIKHYEDPWFNKTKHLRIFWPPRSDMQMPEGWGIMPIYIREEYKERLKPYIITEFINFDPEWGTPIAIARGKKDSISLRKIYYEMSSIIELFHGKKLALDVHPNNGSEFWVNIEDDPTCGCLLIAVRPDGKIPRGMI